MNFGVAKVLAGYLTASVAALVAAVKLACVLGSQMMITFSGSFFR
ncbi:MAG: hypothetical protein ACTS6J_09900 [Burkholderiales bacterium]